jgi:hypothetical protein
MVVILRIDKHRVINQRVFVMSNFPSLLQFFLVQQAPHRVPDNRLRVDKYSITINRLQRRIHIGINQKALDNPT